MKTATARKRNRSRSHAKNGYSQLRQLKRTAAKYTRNGYSLMKDWDGIKKAIRGATVHAKSKANDLIEQSLDNAYDKTVDVKKQVVYYTKARPFKTIGIALVTGACLGFLMRR